MVSPQPVVRPSRCTKLRCPRLDCPSSMLIPHKGHTDTIQIYSVTVMTHVKALQAGHSSHGTSEPITPVVVIKPIVGTGRCYNTILCINFVL